MDSPVTAKGKKCKVCNKKGSPCHMHSPKSKKTPVKGKGKKVSKSAKQGKGGKLALEWEQLEAFDDAMLYQFLLRIPRDQINAVCRASPEGRIAKMCKLDMFRKDYLAAHPTSNNLTRGKKLIVDASDIAENSIDAMSEDRSVTVRISEDDDNRLTMTIVYVKPGTGVVGRFLRGGVMVEILVSGGRIMIEHPSLSAEETLHYIGHPEWSGDFESREDSLVIPKGAKAKEYISEIFKEVSEASDKKILGNFLKKKKKKFM